VHVAEGDGAGWAICRLGHRHWGRYGAAGILVTHAGRVLLQHRAVWTHEGGTWSIPGGALDSHEDTTAAALREAGEETTLVPDELHPYADWTDDHDGWSYTTILATWTGTSEPVPANPETAEVAWWPLEDVTGLELHAGFAAAWPQLRALIR